MPPPAPAPKPAVEADPCCHRSGRNRGRPGGQGRCQADCADRDVGAARRPDRSRSLPARSPAPRRRRRPASSTRRRRGSASRSTRARWCGSRSRPPRVFVADPEIADIQMKTAGLVYIFGKKAGETALYAVDDRERVVLNTTLVVSHNVSRLRQALRAVAPEAEVEVISVDDSLILTGMVHSPVGGREHPRRRRTFRARKRLGDQPDPGAGAEPGQPARPLCRGVERDAETVRHQLGVGRANWQQLHLRCWLRP